MTLAELNARLPKDLLDATITHFGRQYRCKVQQRYFIGKANKRSHISMGRMGTTGKKLHLVLASVVVKFNVSSSV